MSDDFSKPIAKIRNNSTQDSLLRLLKTTQSTNELIYLIQNYKIPVDQLVYNLAFSLCQLCIDSNNELNQELFKTKSFLLTSFINKKSILELEVLRAVKSIDNQINRCIPDLVHCVFSLLIDYRIVKRKTFEKWRRAEETQEKLLKIFKDSKLDKTNIVNDLQVVINKKDKCRKRMVRSLVFALCVSCMDSSGIFQFAKFKSECLVLKKLINKNRKLEIAAMQTIQNYFDRIKIDSQDDLIGLFEYLRQQKIIRKAILNSFGKPLAREKNKIRLKRIICLLNKHDSNVFELIKVLKDELNLKKLTKYKFGILARALCISCKDSNHVFRKSIFKKRCSILKYFVKPGKAINFGLLKIILTEIAGYDKKIFSWLVKNNIISQRDFIRLPGLLSSTYKKLKSKKYKQKRKRKTSKKRYSLKGLSFKSIQLEKPVPPKIEIKKSSVSSVTIKVKKRSYITLGDFINQKKTKSVRASNLKQINMNRTASTKFKNSSNKRKNSKQPTIIEATNFNQISTENKLNSIFYNYNLSEDQIFDHIFKEFYESKRELRLFHLIFYFWRPCLISGYFNLELFRYRCALLKRLIELFRYSQSDLLNYITDLYSRNKTNIDLTAIFKILYEKTVVSKMLFLSWKNTPTGKKFETVLKTFFDRLNQTETQMKANSNQQQTKSTQQSIKQNIIHSKSVINSVLVTESNINKTSNIQLKAPRCNSSQTDINNNKVKLPNQKKNLDSVKTNKKIDALKSTLTSKVELEETYMEKPYCPICMVSIFELRTYKVQLKTGSCGHVWCRPCFDKLFTTSLSIQCQICKKRLSKDLVHDLFI